MSEAIKKGNDHFGTREEMIDRYLALKRELEKTQTLLTIERGEVARHRTRMAKVVELERALSDSKRENAELLAFVKEWLADWTAAGPTDSPMEAKARALIARAEGKS